MIHKILALCDRISPIQPTARQQLPDHRTRALFRPCLELLEARQVPGGLLGFSQGEEHVSMSLDDKLIWDYQGSIVVQDVHGDSRQPDATKSLRADDETPTLAVFETTKPHINVGTLGHTPALVQMPQPEVYGGLMLFPIVIDSNPPAPPANTNAPEW